MPANSAQLLPNESLGPDQFLLSLNGHYTFVYQSDGNLVLYKNVHNQASQWLWDSATNGRLVGTCIMQGDGNLVIYDANGQPIWATNTNASGSHVAVQDDGNVCIYRPDDSWVWDTDTVQPPIPLIDPSARGNNVQRSFSDIQMCVDEPASGVLPAQASRTVLQIESDGSVVAQNQGPLAGVPDLMWYPGQTLRVRMTGGSSTVRSKVREYAVEWTRYANINFAFVDDSQPAEIKIDFDRDGFSWSTIGRDALGAPFNFSTMHFGWFNDNTSEEQFRSTVLHEFGHALGLIHEHQSPVSGIQWDKEKVYADFQKHTPPWDKARVDSNVFEKYSANSTNYSEFDPNSIMLYFFDASLTLDGKGTSYNTLLSDIDKEYIRKWYPHPGDSVGQLRTGDTCDEIEFNVEYGVVPADTVAFLLRSGSNITWWKSIKIPVGGSGYSEIQVKNGGSSELSINKSELDNSRPIRFSKAKWWGVHTMLGYSWDVLPALPGGTRVTLHWTKDAC